jgi:hypothetical protein
MADRVFIPAPQPKDWARFMSKVQIQPDGCWRWTGGTFDNGYGMFTLAGKLRRAHRVAYVWTHGEVDEDLNLDHSCHSRSRDCPGGVTCLHRRCVNPDHLEPVTQKVNMAGTAYVRAETCKRGHPWTEENTRMSWNKRDQAYQRVCRACARDWVNAKNREKNPNPWDRDSGLCRNGHPFDGVDSKGARVCSICRRAARRERYLTLGK